MSKLISILIFSHVILGAIALLSGALALTFPKGKYWHRLTGKVFFYSMMTSAIVACTIAVTPDHENLFLFVIGLFSMYFMISGYRSLRYKKSNPALLFDKITAIILLAVSLFMIIFPIIAYGRVLIVLLIFGITGVVFGFRDFLSYRQPERLKENWLALHLGKMIGGYIAAVTAFVVVNDVFPTILNWLLPGAIGGFFIAFWLKKVNQPKG